MPSNKPPTTREEALQSVDTDAMEVAFHSAMPTYTRLEVDHPNDTGRINWNALGHEDLLLRNCLLAALNVAPPAVAVVPPPPAAVASWEERYWKKLPKYGPHNPHGYQLAELSEYRVRAGLPPLTVEVALRMTCSNCKGTGQIGNHEDMRADGCTDCLGHGANYDDSTEDISVEEYIERRLFEASAKIQIERLRAEDFPRWLAWKADAGLA